MKLTLLFFSFILLFPALVLAADLSIDCPAAPAACSKSSADPLFSSVIDGYWYPGKSITKTINLKNSGPETREMAIRGERASPESILEEVMHISIVGGTTVIWSGSVTDFYGLEKIGMGTFAPGANLDYNFTAFMSSAADDNYQNKETVFDLTLGFWGEPIPTPTPTPTPTAGGGGGTVLGAGVSAPVCTDTKPGSAPTLLSAVAGLNSVTLTWAEGLAPISYYLVTFGNSSGAQTYGNPNVGGSGTISYVVSNLSGGTTYYFKLRAGNGCMPGDYSNEVSAAPSGGLVTGLPAGFAPGVLGEATPSATSPVTAETVPGGAVKGEQYFRLWPWLFSLISLGWLGRFLYKRRRLR
ncbi:MAG: fibronectin type III domain-containing protein [Patescibacteria group bacterium]|nr:fibronectin type III domain-containing protein [Patescibacteria group bacterium]